MLTMTTPCLCWIGKLFSVKPTDSDSGYRKLLSYNGVHQYG